MALGRELLSSSEVLLVLAFYHFLSTECSSIQYYYDDTSFYTAISTVTEKGSPNNVYDCPWFCGRHLSFFATCKRFLLVKAAILCEFNLQLPTDPFIYFW